MIKEVINKLTRNILPDKSELYEAFDEIFSGISDEVLATSFVTLLANCLKDEDRKDILSICINSANNTIKKINLNINSPYLVQSSGTNIPDGYFNIFFARDIVLAACDVPVVKYGIYNPYVEDRTLKLLDKFGISPVFKDENNYNTEDFEKTNYGYIVLEEKEGYFKYTRNITNKLCFENVLNIANNFINPCNAKNIIIGINNNEKVEEAAKVCLEINYINSMVVSSDNNLPFVVPEGETRIAEAWKNKIFAYKLSPNLLEISEYPLEDLKCTDLSEEFDLINNLFQNKLKETALYNTVIINSALALYIVKRSDSIMDGIELAKKTIDSGLVNDKLVSLKER